MMPMLPATDVRIVRAFFVSRFLALSASDVKKFMRARGFFCLPPAFGTSSACALSAVSSSPSSAAPSYGMESDSTSPSFNLTMRVA